MFALITSLLEFVGLLLLVLAAALAVGAWSLPAGVATAGAGLVALSWLITRKGRQ